MTRACLKKNQKKKKEQIHHETEKEKGLFKI